MASGRENVMLCYPFDLNRFKRWGSKALVQPKLDGLRCRCVVDDRGTATLFSSQGNVIVSVPHINQEIEEYCYTDLELDGELYIHGMPFQDITSRVKRTANLHPDYKEVEFHIFDLVSAGKQRDRLKLLDSLIRSSDAIKPVPTSAVMGEDKISYEVTRWYEKGYEGIILRDFDAPYIRKRSTQIMKLKPTKEDVYRIVAFEEEKTMHGKLKDSLGALVLESDGQRFNVGTGFTHEQRKVLWERREELPGQFLMVKYQELTERGVPRFPVALGITNTKVGHDR